MTEDVWVQLKATTKASIIGKRIDLSMGSSSVLTRSMRPKLNIPNVLTLIRIVAIPFILYLLTKDVGTGVPYEEETTFTTWSYGRAAAWLFTLFAATDYLDGWLARKFNQISNFGKLMDPLADKFMLVAFLVCLQHMGRIPWWVVLLVLLRELAISTLREMAAMEGTPVPVMQLGRYKQFIYMVGIGCLMFNGFFLFAHTGQAGQLLMYAGLISAYVSFGEYVYKYSRALKN